MEKLNTKKMTKILAGSDLRDCYHRGRVTSYLILGGFAFKPFWASAAAVVGTSSHCFYE